MVPQMRAFARCQCGDRSEADDLARAALASACGRRESRNREASLEIWLLTVVRDQFRSRVRRAPRARTHRPAAAGWSFAAAAGPAPPGVEEVGRAMMALSCDQREALALVEAARLSCPEAAAVCGCGVAALRTRVGRARKAMTAALASEQSTSGRRMPDGGMAAILFEAVRRTGERALA
jgi:RNA polymerase sigma-70 factor, ECF subfamily